MVRFTSSLNGKKNICFKFTDILISFGDSLGMVSNPLPFQEAGNWPEEKVFEARLPGFKSKFCH